MRTMPILSYVGTSVFGGYSIPGSRLRLGGFSNKPMPVDFGL